MLLGARDLGIWHVSIRSRHMASFHQFTVLFQVKRARLTGGGGAKLG